MRKPAHKSGTAGQYRYRPTTQPGMYLRDIIARIQSEEHKDGHMTTEERGKLKTALEASKAVLTPYPQEPWEVRYKRLVGALSAYCDTIWERDGLSGKAVSLEIAEIMSESP